MTKGLLQSLLILVSPFLLASVVFSQTTWYVDDDNTSGPWDGTQTNPFEYIQHGINASFAGDTVLVMPATYVERINFSGKAILVMSEDGPENTTIDANNTGTTVIFQNGEGLDSILDGFSIINGYSNTGGGVHCNASSPLLRNNIIRNNYSTVSGGGIYISNASPSVVDNISIRNNHADTGGGGISMVGECSPLIANNEIKLNDSLIGGGIYCAFGCAAIIQGGWTGIGNMDANPYLTFAPGGAIHIAPASPCVDAGTNNAPALPLTDFDGDPRAFPGSAAGHGPALKYPPIRPAVDIGSDELCLLPEHDNQQNGPYRLPRK